MHLTTVLRTMRPPFLLLTPVCIFLGYSAAQMVSPKADYGLLALVLVGALLAHIAVNMLNEYLDFRSGLDEKTAKTPFSGGSGSLPENPVAARQVLVVALVSLVLVVISGLYFVVEVGIKILPLGLVGVALVLTYTSWLNRNPFLCLIAPGTGFGLLMVVGSYVALTGHYTDVVWQIALVPFFLVNNLLLLNQYPDMDADKAVGRNHFSIAYGIKSSNLVFAFSIFGAAAIVVLLVLEKYVSWQGYLALLPLLLSILALRGAMQHGAEIGKHPGYMAANVAATLLTPVLLGIAIMV